MTGRLAELERLLPGEPVADDGRRGAPGEGVHHRHPDAVQAARHGVGPGLELAAGVQGGEHRGQRRLFGLLVRVDGNAAAVVLDRHRVIGMEGDVDASAEPGHRLVDGVVDHLPHQVVQAAGTGGADVHGGALAHRLETLEDGDVLGVVRGRALRCHGAPSIVSRRRPNVSGRVRQGAGSTAGSRVEAGPQCC